MTNVFRYDWRLWSLAELVEAATEAGFARAEVWAEGYDPQRGTSDGRYRPAPHMAQRTDWIAYVVAVK